MNKKWSRSIFILSFILLTFPAFTAGEMETEVPRPAKTQEETNSHSAKSERGYNFSDFDGIINQSSYNIVITTGGTWKILTAGDTRTLDSMNLVLENNKLVISSLFPLPGTGVIDVEIHLPELNTIKCSGTGTTIVGGRFSELDVVISGAGGLELSGEGMLLSAELVGVGWLDGAGFMAESVYVKSAGTGDGRVGVRRLVNVNLMGSGDFFIIGDPAEVEINESGTGRVRYYR